MPTCIARKATTVTPPIGTGVRNGPLPAERSRKNGKASRWRCSASINRSPKKPQAQKPATLADSVGDTITLVDGRRLGWAEFGDPQGRALHRLLTSLAPEADSSVLRQPEINQILFDSAREALRQGPEGALWDFVAYAHPWGFKPQDIRPRVQLWHGEADALVPPAYGRYFATALPNAAAKSSPATGTSLCPSSIWI